MKKEMLNLEKGNFAQLSGIEMNTAKGGWLV